MPVARSKREHTLSGGCGGGGGGVCCQSWTVSWSLQGRGQPTLKCTECRQFKPFKLCVGVNVCSSLCMLLCKSTPVSIGTLHVSLWLLEPYATTNPKPGIETFKRSRNVERPPTRRAKRHGHMVPSISWVRGYRTTYGQCFCRCCSSRLCRALTVTVSKDGPPIPQLP